MFEVWKDPPSKEYWYVGIPVKLGSTLNAIWPSQTLLHETAEVTEMVPAKSGGSWSISVSDASHPLVSK